MECPAPPRPVHVVGAVVWLTWWSSNSRLSTCNREHSTGQPPHSTPSLPPTAFPTAPHTHLGRLAAGPRRKEAHDQVIQLWGRKIKGNKTHASSPHVPMKPQPPLSSRALTYFQAGVRALRVTYRGPRCVECRVHSQKRREYRVLAPKSQREGPPAACMTAAARPDCTAIRHGK